MSFRGAGGQIPLKPLDQLLKRFEFLCCLQLHSRRYESCTNVLIELFATRQLSSRKMKWYCWRCISTAPVSNVFLCSKCLAAALEDFMSFGAAADSSKISLSSQPDRSINYSYKQNEAETNGTYQLNLHAEQIGFGFEITRISAVPSRCSWAMTVKTLTEQVQTPGGWSLLRPVRADQSEPRQELKQSIQSEGEQRRSMYEEIMCFLNIKESKHFLVDTKY